MEEVLVEANAMSPSKKERLQRKQKGQTILPDWIKAFEAAAKVTITPDNFLDLDKTEELRISFFDHVRNFEGNPQFASTSALRDLKLDLQNRLSQVDNFEVALFHSMDQFVGALLTQVNIILNNLEPIWGVVEEDLCLATLDLTSGICLEQNFYGPNANYFPDGLLELTCWGKFAGK